MSDFVPIGEALPGIEVAPLPDKVVPLEAIVLVKALDADGDVSYFHRFTKSLMPVEAIGALIGAADVMREERRRLYLCECDDCDGDADG